MNDLLVKCEDGKQAPKEWINNCKKKTLTYSHHYNSGFGNPYRNASHYASQQVIKPKEKIKEKEETEDITQKEYDILEAQAEVLESSMYGEDRNYFDLIKEMYYDCNETIAGLVNLIDNPRSDKVNNNFSWDTLREMAKDSKINIHDLRKFILTFEEDLDTYFDYLDHTDFSYGISTNDKQTQLGYV
jgi:hypothetical protein